MKGIYSHAWLQSFFNEPLPSPDIVSDGLMRHAFEVEDVVRNGDDTVYELDILPNRSVDCLAHYGVAKEIAAVFSLTMRRHYFTEPFQFAREAACIQTEYCDRYTIMKVDDVSLQETPEEIRLRLEAIGQRSINPIVDLSNYVLFDIGQPIHAFDAEKVSGEFGVRQARDGETLTLLGGDTVTLSSDDIVITDADRVVALAGVKGGEDTGVSPDTKSIYIESATFRGATIRRTMRRLNLVSDASLRFSQNIPPELVGYSAHRAAEVFGEHGTIVDSFDSKRVPIGHRRMTGISVAEVNAILGSSHTEEDVRAALERLQLPHTYEDPRALFIETVKAQTGKPYKWGASVTKDAPDAFDCSSLVCWCASRAGKSIPRISVNQFLSAAEVTDPRPGDLIFMESDDRNLPLHTESVYESGYPVSPGSVKTGFNHVAVLLDADTIVEAEGSSGANAVVTKKFDRKRMLYAASIWDNERRFVVTVPVERPDIRNAFDLTEEVGRILGYDTVPSAAPTAIPSQSEQSVEPIFAKHLALVKSLRVFGFSEVITHSFFEKGDVCVSHPVAADKGCLRTDLRKGIEEALERNAYVGELLGVSDIRIMEIGSVFTERGESIHLALGITATLGRSGPDIKEIEKSIKKALPIPGGFDGGVWEVPLDEVPLEPDAYDFPPVIGRVRYTPFSPFPFVLRDIAVFVPDGTTVEQTEHLLREHGGEYLRRVNMFDTFEKDGKVSYAFRLVFQSDDRTLDDSTVNVCMEALNAVLQKNGFEVR